MSSLMVRFSSSRLRVTSVLFLSVCLALYGSLSTLLFHAADQIQSGNDPPLVLLRSYGRSSSQRRPLHHPRVVKLSTQHPAASDFTSRTVEPLGQPCCEEYRYFASQEPWEEGDDCQPSAEWQTKSFPTCNLMHESPFHEFAYKYLGKGIFRRAYMVNATADTRLVYKMLRMDKSFESRALEMPMLFQDHRVDALALERLTSSPNVINIFTHCGNSMITESGVETLNDAYVKTFSIEDVPDNLNVAAVVAEALHTVHSIDGDDLGATLAHGDFHHKNVLLTADGRLVLNDFNQGILIPRTKDGPCHYSNYRWRGLDFESRPPERFHRHTFVAVDKVDVFGLGLIFATLLTGAKPFEHLDRPGLRQPRVLRLDREILESQSTAVQALVYAALACLAFDPKDRPSAKRVAEGLKTAVAWSKQHEEKNLDEIKALFMDEDKFAQVEVWQGERVTAETKESTDD